VCVIARLWIKTPAGSERPIIFVDDVRLGIGQEFAGLEKFVEIGDQADLIARNPSHDVPRLDFAGMLQSGGADQLGERLQRIG
jgi:hypothetical protein